MRKIKDSNKIKEEKKQEKQTQKEYFKQSQEKKKLSYYLKETTVEMFQFIKWLILYPFKITPRVIIKDFKWWVLLFVEFYGIFYFNFYIFRYIPITVLLPIEVIIAFALLYLKYLPPIITGLYNETIKNYVLPITLATVMLNVAILILLTVKFLGY